MPDLNHQPLLEPGRVKVLKKAESKKCVFDTLTKLLTKGQCEVGKNDIFDALIAREKLGNTYIGNGIAIPRAHLQITNTRAALIILKKGLKLNSADKQDIRVFLGILIPESNRESFKKILTNINKKIQKKEKLSKLIDSENIELLTEYFEKLLSSETN
ncbi:MAG: PTS sugar transporter subunit IIA [Cocleimonas sp.]